MPLDDKINFVEPCQEWVQLNSFNFQFCGVGENESAKASVGCAGVECTGALPYSEPNSGWGNWSWQHGTTPYSCAEFA